MSRKAQHLTIDLESLTDQDRADVLAIAAKAGEDAAACDLSHPTVGVLTGLIYVTLRRESPRVTALRCARLACDALGVPYVR